MEWQAWLTLGIALLVVAMLALTRLGVDLVMLGAVTALLLAGVLTPEQAFGGFANEGVLTVAALFAVAAGIRETGAMAAVAHRLLGRPHGVAGAQMRLMLPVAAMSAFMNNTPLVAMMLPVVDDWARKCKIPVSKLMMPLSFATILGGLCTLLGTSTNVILSGLMARQTGTPLHFFDPIWLGLPCALAGLTYMLVASRWLLPDRGSVADEFADPRQYTVEMIVAPGSGIVGRTVEQAGLRHLTGVYLVEIERGDQLLTAVGPEEVLRDGDRLVFAGVVESVVELQRTRGLTLATDQVFKLGGPRSRRCLIEAVVSDSCPLVGQTIREGRFRTVYDAAVVALARNGERVNKKIGDIHLRPGDTLLLEAHPGFVKRHHNSRDFYLVSQVDGSTPPSLEKAGTALAILAAMVLAASLGWLPMLTAAILAAGAMLAAGCVRGPVARRAVDGQVLVAIGASFGLGKALEVTGAAQQVASALIGLGGDSPWLVLALVYLLTMLFTEVMSNNAAAVLVFPLALAAATGLGVNPLPFVMSIMVAASCGFATPIGYQTNLMVYGPGGYSFRDFVRFGGLLNLLVAAVTLALAPLVWPF